MTGASEDGRLLAGLERLNQLVRQLITEGGERVPLQVVVDEARAITNADFSAALLLRTGATDEVEEFAYNAPRELFPEQLPRAVGLLAVPVRARAPMRVDDIRGHHAGVGIPVDHPPIGPLLAAPVIAGGAVLGEVLVANRAGGPTFTGIDERLLDELAAHLATAVTVAATRRAHREVEDERQALTTLALHNIRTPLTVAKGFLSTLRVQYLKLTPEIREEALDAIGRALDRIHGLAEGALLRDDQAPSAHPPAMERIQTVPFVEKVLADCREMAGSIELACMEDDAPPSFLAEPERVSEVLVNLLTNAIRFSPPHGRVVVSCRAEGRSVRFDVTDQGPGIPEAARAGLFDPPSPGSPGGHHERGLWLVSRLVENAGGAVGVVSREGDGSTFWFTLPVE